MVCWITVCSKLIYLTRLHIVWWLCKKTLVLNLISWIKKSSKLWHKRLEHISIERIKRLVNDGVLKTFDFTNFSNYVDCIKGKQSNKTKKNAKRNSKKLEIIHTDICCLDMDSHSQKIFHLFHRQLLTIHVFLLVS